MPAPPPCRRRSGRPRWSRLAGLVVTTSHAGPSAHDRADRRTAGRTDAGREGGADGWPRPLVGPVGGTPGHPVAEGDGRSERCAWDGPVGNWDSLPLHPERYGAGRHLEPRAGRGTGWGAGRRDPGPGLSRAAGPDGQPAQDPAGRAELRVHVRGPVPDRQDRGRLHPWRAGRRHRDHGQALRGQRLRVRAHDHLIGGGRTDPPGGLDASVPDGGAGWRDMGRDGFLQPGERDVRSREPVDAGHGAARRVGLRRDRGLGLVRCQVDRCFGHRRAGPGDARAAALVRGPTRGGRGGRRGPRIGCGRFGPPPPAPGRADPDLRGTARSGRTAAGRAGPPVVGTACLDRGHGPPEE